MSDEKILKTYHFQYSLGYKYYENFCVLFIFYGIYLDVTIRTAPLNSQDNVDTFHILLFIVKKITATR